MKDYKDVHKFVQGLCKHLLPQASDDLAQEIHLRLLQNSDACRAKTERQYFGWVKTIIYHEAAEWRRRFVQYKGRIARYANGYPRSISYEIDDPLLHEEKIKCVHKVLDVLLDREIFEMAYLEGMTAKQIAAHTGLPLGTVKSRIYHGRLMFRELWAEIAV